MGITSCMTTLVEKGSSRNLMEEQNKKMVALDRLYSMPNMECTQQIDLQNDTCIKDAQNANTHI